MSSTNALRLPRGPTSTKIRTPVVVEHLDGAPELDREQPVLDHQFADRVGIVRVGGGRRARVNRQACREDRGLLEDPAQVVDVGGEQGGVVGPVEVQLLGRQPLAADDLHRPRCGVAPADHASTAWCGQLSMAT